jgi:YesN/AraC family two-component response regulator
LMTSDKIYQDLEMSLESVSNLLAIKPHQLSHILNTQYHTTFTDYVTKYRIESAKRILAEDPQVTILSVCYQVGFNSKSQFNTVFKKLTGKTPKEFRKQPVS